MLSPNKTRRREEIQFICVHWTGGTYASAVDWCCRKESEVSYHIIIGPKGEVADLVPWNYAAWAVGWSKSIDPMITFKSGNHASYSIALAGGPPKGPTDEQVAKLIELLVVGMKHLGWGAGDVHRIWGHNQCAVYPPKHKLAGQFGRKSDPEGQNWLLLEPIREAVSEKLAL